MTAAVIDVAHLGDRLRAAALWARRAIAAAAADGIRLPDGAALDVWHLAHTAEEAAEHIAPGTAPPPCIWALEPPAPGYLAPARVTLLIDGALIRYTVERAIGEVDAAGRAELHGATAPPA